MTVDSDPSAEDELLRGTETILLVEDDEDVRLVACRILTQYGYDVISVRDEGDAFLECENSPKRIHLLLTDVVMRFMDGRELAQRFVRIRPDLKVLYMSGYTDKFGEVLGPDIDFFQKPLEPRTLAQRVRAVLDAPLRRSEPHRG